MAAGRVWQWRGAMRLGAIIAFAALAVASPVAAQFSPGYKFLDSVRKKDGEAVQSALSGAGGTIINTRDVTSGETALHIVTARRDLTWMNFLLERGAAVDPRDARGISPLQVATSLSFVDGVTLLLAYKADPDQADDTGETPLISAVHGHNLALMRVLLAAGGDPDRPDSSGRSARDYAKVAGGGQLLATIETNARKKGAGPAPVYGPKL